MALYLAGLIAPVFETDVSLLYDVFASGVHPNQLPAIVPLNAMVNIEVVNDDQEVQVKQRHLRRDFSQLDIDTLEWSAANGIRSLLCRDDG